VFADGSRALGEQSLARLAARPDAHRRPGARTRGCD